MRRLDKGFLTKVRLIAKTDIHLRLEEYPKESGQLLEDHLNIDLLGLAEDGKSQAIIRMDDVNLRTRVDGLLAEFERESFNHGSMYFIIARW